MMCPNACNGRLDVHMCFPYLEWCKPTFVVSPQNQITVVLLLAEQMFSSRPVPGLIGSEPFDDIWILDTVRELKWSDIRKGISVCFDSIYL